MREEFNAKISEIPEENIVYIDESGFDVNMKKEYGWPARGKKIMGDKSGKRGKRISVIAGLINRKHLIAPTCFECYTNTDVFNAWLEQGLLPELKPNQTIVLDNAAFHTSQKTRELVKSAGCHLLYLPPYSLDLFLTFTHKYKKSIRLLCNILITL